jgi:hypothetical protein
MRILIHDLPLELNISAFDLDILTSNFKLAQKTESFSRKFCNPCGLLDNRTRSSAYNKVLMLVLPINTGSEFSSYSVSTIPFTKMLNIAVYHLMTKMVEKKIPPNFVHVINSLYEETKIRVIFLMV